MKRALTVVALVGATALLGGCGYLDDSVVEYSGGDDQEVGACASLASAGYYRTGEALASKIIVRVDGMDVTQTILDSDYTEFEYDISGETEVRGGESAGTYDWTCLVSVDLKERTSTAKLLTFEQR